MFVHTRLKDISKENRPRERFEKFGASVLSDVELLAILLRTGTKNESVIDISNKIISKYGLSNLSELSLIELQKIRGIGPAKAIQFLSLFEFSKRHNKAVKNKKIIIIENSEDVYNYFVDELGYKKKEYFYALLLNSKNRVIKSELISIGTLNSSLAHPREVFKSAIRNSANSLILIHNHPSGVVEPSVADSEITKQFINASKILNIEVIDHVIIGKNEHYSFKKEMKLF